jgi:hypothetical protein
MVCLCASLQALCPFALDLSDGDLNQKESFEAVMDYLKTQLSLLNQEHRAGLSSVFEERFEEPSAGLQDVRRGRVKVSGDCTSIRLSPPERLQAAASADEDDELEPLFQNLVTVNGVFNFVNGEQRQEIEKTSTIQLHYTISEPHGATVEVASVSYLGSNIRKAKAITVLMGQPPSLLLEALSLGLLGPGSWSHPAPSRQMDALNMVRLPHHSSLHASSVPSPCYCMGGGRSCTGTAESRARPRAFD